MVEENKRKNGPLETSAQCIAVIRKAQEINLLFANRHNCHINKEQFASLENGGYLTIGSSTQNDIVITDVTAPRACIDPLHCFVYKKNDAYWIYDCSTTGTIVAL